MLEDEELLNILQSNHELPSDDSSNTDDSDVDLEEEELNNRWTSTAFVPEIHAFNEFASGILTENINLSTESTEIDFFKHYFGEEVVLKLVEFTNAEHQNFIRRCDIRLHSRAVCHEFGVQVGRAWLALALPAAGMWGVSGAMLPSAWSCALAAAALACWWRRRYKPAVAFTAANAIYSWPFTGLLGIPIAIDMIAIKRQYLEFLKYSGICLVTMLLPMVIIDSWHYGRLVIAPVNIVTYNIFTDHGPDLYGVEPWTYYFVNGFLNFNFVWMLALYSPLALYMCYRAAPRSTARAEFCSPYWFDLLPLVLWLLVFMVQPHKEERFLYPVYSLIILAGAIALDCIQKMVYTFGSEILKVRFEGVKVHYLSYTMPLMVLFTLVAGIGGISRITALYTNYHSAMSILQPLPPSNGHSLTVCYGKEWHRSPSSFLLPEGYRIRFIQSDFDGMMPAPYADTSNATRLIQPHFNDHNKGDDRTYLKPSQCHYLIDSDIGNPSTLEPPYYKDTSVWEIVTTLPILNPEKSHKIFRAFYVPVFSERNNVFGRLYLLKNRFIA